MSGGLSGGVRLGTGGVFVIYLVWPHWQISNQ